MGIVVDGCICKDLSGSFLDSLGVICDCGDYLNWNKFSFQIVFQIVFQIGFQIGIQSENWIGFQSENWIGIQI